ncbi:MAG: Tad domain-containing protein [Pseudomonadota bacterium]
MQNGSYPGIQVKSAKLGEYYMLPVRFEKSIRAALKGSVASVFNTFRRDEEGGIIIFTLLLLISMLVMGGMAVDFMRFESERARLQSVSDRAVLAAADLDQTEDPKAIVEDFFAKAGYASNIVGEPDVVDDGNSRSVLVDSTIDTNTFYLRLIGIDDLSAPARSSAVEGTGNIEISLVLDISGSMGNWVASESATKMDLLIDAAQGFVDDVMLPELDGRVSMNLIMYSQQVGIGDELFAALNTTPDIIYNHDPVLVGSSKTGIVTEMETGAPTTLSLAELSALDSFTNPSRCVDFNASEFNDLSLNTTRTYKQVEYFDRYGWQQSPVYTICPKEDAEQIIVMSQDADELKDAIGDLRPTSWTYIHLGLKWGAALLDPSTRGLIAGLPSVDGDFAGLRPADYDDNNTIKYLVLMTDGRNVSSRRIEPDDYDTYEERQALFDYELDYWRRNIRVPTQSQNQVTDPEGSAGQFDTWMQQLCDLAGKPDANGQRKMKLFTIAMGADSHGTSEMADCASVPAWAFSTDLSGTDGQPGIDEIFEAIAAQITALRLNL